VSLSVQVASLGVFSTYGRGVEALVEGIRAGVRPTCRATGIGYPNEPEPSASKFPFAPRPPGEKASAEALLDTVTQALDPWRNESRNLSDPGWALVVGTGGFLYASGAELYWRATGGKSNEAFQVRGPAWGASLLTSRFDLRGPVLTLTTGCSSSANALLVASEMLARGEAKRAIVVGAEGLSAVTLSGFEALMLLDAQGCRPFDRDREGLQLGEAVAVLILEATAAAGSDPLILGGANLCDTHHLTSASPDGSVMQEVMAQALAQAQVTAADIVAVKAHGTGSIDSDRAEANALRGLFGPSLPPVVGLKGYLGHTLGACGALETLALIACAGAGFIPATAGFSNADPELGVEPLRAPISARPGPYLLNFFGFGGNYTSLVAELR
jgi:3-oxoacyl-(acyl-carrier-protein) synthase